MRHSKSDRPMSAMGHKRTFAAHKPMSALPPRADMCGAIRNVCFGPKADIVGLFDDLIGGDDEALGDREAERLGRL